jgi:tetratricopeptide (TPR) repeat protein
MLMPVLRIVFLAAFFFCAPAALAVEEKPADLLKRAAALDDSSKEKLDLVSRAVDLDPSSMEAHKAYMELVLGRGDFSRVAAGLAGLEKLDAPDAGIRVLKGRSYIFLGLYEKAVNALAGVRFIEPADLLARAHEGTWQWRKAAAIYKTLVQKKDASGKAAADYAAFLFFRTGETAAAMEYLQGFLGKNPGDADALFALGRLELSLGMEKKALETLKKALEKDPKNVKGLLAVAGILDSWARPAGEPGGPDTLEELRGKAEESETDRYYKKALEAAGGDAALLVACARAMRRRAKAGKAASALEKALLLAPGSIEVIEETVLSRLGRFEYAEAKKAAAAYLAQNKHSVRGRLLLVSVYRAEGADNAAALSAAVDSLLKDAALSLVVVEKIIDYPWDEKVIAELEKVLKKWIEAYPGNARVLALGARFFRARGQHERAAALLKKARVLCPNELSVWLLEAGLLAARNKGKQAAGLLDEYAKKHPADTRGLVELARARGAGWNFKEALAAWDKLLARHTGAGSFMYEKGLLYLRFMMTKEALATFKELKETAPSYSARLLEAIKRSGGWEKK